MKKITIFHITVWLLICTQINLFGVSSAQRIRYLKRDITLHRDLAKDYRNALRKMRIIKRNLEMYEEEGEYSKRSEKIKEIEANIKETKRLMESEKHLESRKYNLMRKIQQRLELKQSLPRIQDITTLQ